MEQEAWGERRGVRVESAEEESVRTEIRVSSPRRKTRKRAIGSPLGITLSAHRAMRGEGRNGSISGVVLLYVYRGVLSEHGCPPEMRG